MYLKWIEYHKTKLYTWTFYIKDKLTFSSVIDKNANKCTQDKHHDQWKDPNQFRVVVWCSLLICWMSSTVKRGIFWSMWEYTVYEGKHVIKKFTCEFILIKMHKSASNMLFYEVWNWNDKYALRTIILYEM